LPPSPAWLLNGGRAHHGHEESYRLDASGDVVHRPTVRGSQTLEWDAGHRLLSVRDGGGNETRMEYDALGRRVSKSVEGRTTRFYWDDETLAAELTDDGTEREFVYRPGSFTPLAAIDTGVWFFETDNI